jgi:hypothetical protein
MKEPLKTSRNRLSDERCPTAGSGANGLKSLPKWFAAVYCRLWLQTIGYLDKDGKIKKAIRKPDTGYS